jgi:4-hydroxy-tetrahydrodipicolinate synthase
MLSGSIVALATPFNQKGIDEDALRELIEFQIGNGTSAILVSGCTGESFTINSRERNRLNNIAKEQAAGRVPIIVGTGAPSIECACQMSHNAKELNADYVLVITPYGNKPSQEALYDYYAKIAKISPPVILYNVPSRTSVSLAPETTVKLTTIHNIVAIKEASGSLDTVSYILEHCPDFTVFSGDDSLTLPMLSLGAKGVISTVANILPKKMALLCESFFKGDIETARKIHFELFPVIKALFIESNPVPLKEAMNLMGLIVGDCRPPLGRMSDANREILINVLFDGGYLGE